MSSTLASVSDRLSLTRLYTVRFVGTPANIANGRSVLAMLGTVVAHGPVVRTTSSGFSPSPVSARSLVPEEPGPSDICVGTSTWLATTDWIGLGHNVGHITRVLLERGSVPAVYWHTITLADRTAMLAAVERAGGPAQLGSPIEEAFRSLAQTPLRVAASIAQDLYDAAGAAADLARSGAEAVGEGASRTLDVVERTLTIGAVIAGVGLGLYALQGGTLKGLVTSAKSLGKAVRA